MPAHPNVNRRRASCRINRPVRITIGDDLQPLRADRLHFCGRVIGHDRRQLRLNRAGALVPTEDRSIGAVFSIRILELDHCPEREPLGVSVESDMGIQELMQPHGSLR